MVFLGTTFCSGKNTLAPPAAQIKTMNKVKLTDGTYNQLFLSSDSSLTVKNFDDEWNYDTKLNATFEKDLEAGNSGFCLNNTDKIVIRRREPGDVKWTTVYVKDIQKEEDFNISILDTYARQGVEYEYSISSFSNYVENSYVTEKVFSDFNGFYITDKDSIFGTMYNVDSCDTTRNADAQTIHLLNNKYPSVVSNASVNYDSGSISGDIVKLDTKGRFDQYATLKYRKAFKEKLISKKPLILKKDDGRIWLIKVVGNLSDSQNEHPDLRKLGFEWVEIGDVNDMQTLYNHGLIDIESRWW